MHALPSHPSTATDVVAAAASIAVIGAAATLRVEASVVAVLTVAAAAAVIDLRERRIPDALVALATLSIVFSVVVDPTLRSGVALGAALAVLPMFVIHVASPAALGFGDVKLAAPLGGALGAIDPILALVALCIASAVTAAVGLARRQRALAFAPGMVVGATVAFGGSLLTDWFPAWR